MPDDQKIHRKTSSTGTPTLTTPKTLNTLKPGTPAEWHIFDWYNGTLKSDAKIITHNLNAATSTNSQHKQLASLSDANSAIQLSLAARFQEILQGLK